jgi:AbiV family abortive infection protein
MTRRSFLPSSAAAVEGARLAVTNAKRLRDAHSVLRDHQMFGASASTLILAAEEAMKAVVLAAKGLGFNIDRRTLGGVLYHHEVRHGTVMVIQMASVAWGETIQSFVSQDWDIETEEELDERLRGMLVPLMESDALNLERIFQTDREIEWWGNASELREDALYVNWDNGSWTSPSDWTAERLASVVEHTNIVFNVIVPQLDSFLSMDLEGMAVVGMLVAKSQNLLNEQLLLREQIPALPVADMPKVDGS